MVSMCYRVGHRNSTHFLYDDKTFFDVLECNITGTKGTRNSRVISLFFLGGGGVGSKKSEVRQLKNSVKTCFLRIKTSPELRSQRFRRLDTTK